MKHIKKTLSLLLVCAMVFGLLPVNVSAGEPVVKTGTEQVSSLSTEMNDAEVTDETLASEAVQDEKNVDELDNTEDEQPVDPETAAGEDSTGQAANGKAIPIPEENASDVGEETVTAEENQPLDSEQIQNAESTEAAEDVMSVPVMLANEGIATAAITIGEKPADGTTMNQPFASGTGGSSNFRIPALVTLGDGTLVAAADARWNHSRDGYGLDTIVSYSEDNGANWKYTFANYLGDNGNAYNVDSTAFIDPALAVTSDNTLYMLVDLYPHGTYIGNVKNGTGFDNNAHLLLRESSKSSYDYYVGDFSNGSASICKADGTQVSGYTVDEYYNIEGNGCDTNLFFSDSPYQVLSTSYLYLTKSTDGGKTWSVPMMLNSQVKKSFDMFYGVGPGRGLVTSTGRIIFPCYTYTTQDGNTSVIYSDDNGQTWTRSAGMTSQSSEAALTEADGRIYMFTRHGGYYVSEDNGATWSNKQSVDIRYTTSCQLSAITYSEKIDGKTAILLSAPTNNRTTGKIFVGLVQEDGSISWNYTYNVNNSTYQYSCLTELNDGSVGLLYENDSAAITYSNYSINAIARNAQIGEPEVTPGFVDSNGTTVTNVVFDAGATEAKTVSFQGLAESESLAVQSSNEQVVTVSVDGNQVNLSPVGAGTATVTATVQSTSRAVGDTAALQVTVKASEQQITPGTVTSETKEGSTTYELDTDGIDSGAEYLIVAKNSSTYYALKNAGGADGASTGAAEVTVSGTQVKGVTDDTALIWKFEGSENSFTIKNQSAYVYLKYTSGPWGIGGSTKTLSNVSNADTQQCTVRKINRRGTYTIYGNNRYLQYSAGMYGASAGFNGSNSAYDLYLYKKTTTPGGTVYKTDVTPITKQITKADTLQQELYTAESWAVLGSALVEAKELNSVTEHDTQTAAQAEQDKINGAAQKVADAIAALKKKPVDISVVVGGSNSVAVSGNLNTAGLDTSVAAVKVENDTMTVTGVAEGSTSVVVGDTTYNIKVTKVPEILDVNTTPFLARTGTGTGKKVTKLTTSVGLTFDVDLDISGSDVVWSIADTSIATVDRNGNVTGVKAGETTLTATVDGVAYTIPVVIRQDATASNTKIYDYYLSEITDTTVYMSVSMSTDLVEVQEGEAIYISFDSNANTAVDFFGTPHEGYALTRMNSTNSAGHYMALNSTDPKQTDFYTKDGAAGKNQRGIFGHEAVAEMVQAALDKECDGGMGWTRPSNDGSGVTSDLTFRSEKLPTVTKKVASVNDVAYTEGMLAHVGEKVVFDITVTQYAAQDNIEYSNVLLEDNLANATFARSTSNSKTITELSNKAVAEDTNHTYQVEYIITDEDLDKTIINTVDLTYTYQSAFSSGSFGGTANADARFTAASFNPKDIVVDFGLPVTIDYSGTNDHGRYDLASGTAVYGDVEVSDNKVTYKPNKVLQDIDTVTLTNIAGGTYTFRVYPATTVYYEEGFAAYKGNWRGTTSVNYTSEQTLEFVDADTKVNNYGYDAVYANDRTASNGTQASSDTKGDLAAFTFTGTGADIYANCSGITGTATVQVRVYEDNTMVKLATVNTSANGTYGDQVKEGAYNTPIVSINGLTHGNYTVKIFVSSNMIINLDGFRVYGTLSDEATNSVYKNNLEEAPSYFEMRDAVLTAMNVNGGTDSAAVYAQVYEKTDGKIDGIVVLSAEIDAVTDDPKQLLEDGPKNELYLAKDQSLVFKVKTERDVQLGIKAPAGVTAYTIQADSKEVKEASISSSVDMFYDIDPGTITITNTGDNILSITKLKICDEPVGGFAELTENDFADALVSLGLNETVEPEVTYADATLRIAVNDTDGNALATTALTANGIIGEMATFTATEIQTAVEALELPEGYELEEVTYTDVEVAYGESGEVSFTAEIAEAEEPTPEPEPAPEETPDTTETVINKVINTIKNIFSKLFGW